jgi:LAO/AO transport system kinase
MSDQENIFNGLNPAFKKRKIKLKSSSFDVDLNLLKDGDIATLSKAITFVESTRSEDEEGQASLIHQILPYSGKSIRIGITGIPGAGKSTLIESLGLYFIEQQHKVAVLAIDPSSQLSKGSILGDKTRMENLAKNSNAFIRPTPSSGITGGVARKTREAMLLCEAAGYDIILIETVGVGQSELMVHSLVDIFLLVSIPGAGDELQGIKRGIMEMADLVLVNKCDIDTQKAALAHQQIENAIHLFPPHPSGVDVRVIQCSAFQNLFLDRVYEQLMKISQTTQANGYFEHKRKEQDVHWFQQTLEQMIIKSIFNKPEIIQKMAELKQEIIEGKKDPFIAATFLYHLLKNSAE